MSSSKKSLKRQFATYAIPSIVGMTVSSFYTIIDGIFVGRGVGETALGAINIAFPFIMLQIALAMMIAVGGANLFSASRGRGDKEGANNIFLQSMVLVTVFGLVVNIAAMVFIEDVALILGADEILLPQVIDYLWWICFFGIIQMPAMTLGVFIRNDDAPNTELAGTITATILNISLDYLFVMVLHWGVKGAAIATGIGQTISLLIFVTHFMKKDRILRFKRPKWALKDIKKMALGGFPTFLMEFSQSAVAYSFNIALLYYIGTVGVSYYSIVLYICSIFSMMLVGLVQGAQPLMSFNFGKGDKETIYLLRSMAIKVGLIMSVVTFIVVALAGNKLTAIFLPDNVETAGMAAEMMFFYFTGYFPVGITLINILFFQVIEKQTQASFISFLRCIGFIQIFLLVLPLVNVKYGLFLAFPLGELCHCLISQGIYMKEKRKMLKV